MTSPPARKRSFWRRLLVWSPLIVIVGVLAAVLWLHRFGVPEDFDHMEAQFKYGSIGADQLFAQAPVPYWLWKVMPEVFPPAQTIQGGLGPRNGKPGFAAFGMVTEGDPDRPIGWKEGEPRFERPIGVSKRRVFGMDLVGLNCAFCHLGSVKTDPKKPPFVVLGGTGQNVDIEQYFLYLFAALTSERFTADNIMPAIDRELKRQGAELGWVQRLLYRYVIIPILPHYLRSMEQKNFDFIYPQNDKRLPEFGPGRVDTWGLYKRTFLNPPEHDSIPGTVDFPPLWNQKAREGMRMHWDGNTDVLIERNVISALSIVGRRIEYLDFARLTRVTEWTMGLLPPRYPDLLPDGLPKVDAALALRGAGLFSQNCARCHSAQGDRVGRVEPIEALGTDPQRIREFIPRLADTLNTLGTDHWQLRNFRIQNGYVNTLLDGIWLRAPYLHNGSVPTLRDLLAPPEARPKRFCRGSDEYDWTNLGFVSATVTNQGNESCPTSFLYDTSVRGNSNRGHGYGTGLADADKDALIEFLKTL